MFTKLVQDKTRFRGRTLPQQKVSLLAKPALEEPKREFTPAGFLSVIAPNLGWGISDVCIALIGRGQVVTWVHGVTGAMLGILILLVLRKKFVVKDFFRAFPIGLHRAIIWGALFIAFQEDNPTIAITILSFSLIISIVVFGPLLGEKVTPKIIVLACIGVMGVILTSLSTLSNFEISFGAILALIVLPVASAGTFILRKVQQSVPATTTPTYMYIWIAIIYTPIMFFINPEFNFSNHEYFLILVLTITGAGGHFLFSLSQSRTSFRFNAIASTIHTPSTAIFSWLILDDLLKPHQLVGMIIVTAVVGYVSATSKKKKDPEQSENLVLDH